MNLTDAAPTPSAKGRKRLGRTSKNVDNRVQNYWELLQQRKFPRMSELANILKNTLKVIDGAKLWCNACNKNVGTKKSVTKAHCNCKKHLTNLRRLSSYSGYQGDIRKILRNEAEARTTTTCVDEATRMYRFETAQAFMTNGIPMYKIDNMRYFLEGGWHDLGSTTIMSDQIPLVQMYCRQQVAEQIKNTAPKSKHYAASVIFDGTTADGEAMCVVVRIVDKRLVVRQLLVRFRLLMKSLNSDDLAKVLAECLYQRSNWSGK